jgi:anti-sigma factor (TIGR02949 family)
MSERPSDEQPRADCRGAMRQLWDYLDQELTDERMAAVRDHLDSCAGCLPHHDFAKAFLEAIASTRANGGCPPKVRARVLERLRSEGFVARSDAARD